MPNIDRDRRRFKNIVRGKIRKNLKDFIKQGHMLGRRGKDKIAIPIPYIKLPRFRQGMSTPGGKGEGEGEGEGGVGQGPGKIGTPLGPGKDKQGQGPKAGQGHAEHPLEVELTIEELAELLKEELGLPNIEPKGNKKNIYTEKEILRGLRRVGPDALLRFEKSYLEALQRQIASGEYNPEDPIVTITKDDMRYLSWKKERKPIANAVLIYMMDVSGSMSGEHRDVARKISFWVDTWIRSQYNEVESVYIIHDWDAEEVDEKNFYETVAAGGTRIFSAYDLANKIIDKKYPPEDWNIYLFHYSDGENWGGGWGWGSQGGGSKEETEILEKQLLPKSNLLCYGQIDLTPSWWGNYGGGLNMRVGEFKKTLDDHFTKSELEHKVITTSIKGEEDIYDTLKLFLGTGK